MVSNVPSTENYASLGTLEDRNGTILIRVRCFRDTHGVTRRARALRSLYRSLMFSLVLNSHTGYCEFILSLFVRKCRWNGIPGVVVQRERLVRVECFVPHQSLSRVGCHAS